MSCIKPPEPPPKNAVLYFEKPGTNFVVDPATCNKVVETVSVTVEAVLTQVGNVPNERDQAGLNTLARRVRGYLLGTPPGDAPYHGRVSCEINGESGTFHFMEQVTAYRAQIISAIGIPVEGSFQTEGGGR